VDYDAVIDSLDDLAGRDVVVAIQFSEGSLDPIAVLRGRLESDTDNRQRFDVGDASIIVRAEDLVDASWVEGLGEEAALRFDLNNVQITVSPGSADQAELLEEEA
jgi:hypothetical protein